MVNTGGGEAAEWSGQAIDASANARLAAHPIGRNDGWNDARGPASKGTGQDRLTGTALHENTLGKLIKGSNLDLGIFRRG